MTERHIFLPLLPGQPLNPNRSASKAAFHAEARARLELRTAVATRIREVHGPLHPTPPAYAGVVIGMLYCTRRKGRDPRDNYYRPRDPANLISACKPVFDGLKDAGWLLDDDFDHMVLLPCWRLKVDTYAGEGLDIRVREVLTPWVQST